MTDQNLNSLQVLGSNPDHGSFETSLAGVLSVDFQKMQHQEWLEREQTASRGFESRQLSLTPTGV